jgi:diketogulonate reductase-like aldo/keto reductase
MEAAMKSDHTELLNGVMMPRFGLGVLHIPDGEITRSIVGAAIDSGYQLIDTAKVYGNEEGVGEAVRSSGVNRDKLFITSKVWNSDQGLENTLAAYEDTLDRMGLEYLDLYLIHWPGQRPALFVETWRALEQLYQSERVRAIGVSNFNIEHLDLLMGATEITPMVNQIEFHPRLQQPELVDFCHKNRIQLEAWRPIMKGAVNEIPLLREIGERYGKTPVQVTIRWVMDRGIVVIPKTQNPKRIIENADVFDFSLTNEEIESINALDASARLGPDPKTFNLEFP